MKHSHIIMLFFIACGLLSSCEGGKSRSNSNKVACSAGQHEERGQCVANVTVTSCTANQVLVNGACKTATSCKAGFYLENNKCIEGELSIEVLSQSACYVPADGTTRLILQYIVRDEAGIAIDPVMNALKQPTALNNELRIDNRAIDVESVLDQDSESLNSDLVMSLVLDSSYSMLEHTPPAFEPMKQAAIKVLKDTQAAWSGAESNFYWELIWFNTVIYRPKANNAGEAWSIDDIVHIPEPKKQAFTSLYKSVDYMTNVHAELYQQGIAAGPRDQHVMVVLSDGADNYGYFGNAKDQNEGNYNQMLFWDEIGYKEVKAVTDITPATSALPNLRIHVIGLGSDVNETELQAIAKSGSGKYFYGSSADTLSNLFDQVQRELVTQQTLGAQIPLADGEYKFELHSERLSDNNLASYSWTMKVGSTLPSCAIP